MTDQLTDTGHFATANASKYLQQLCKHLGHRVEVTFDAAAGTVALPAGPVTLTASDTALVVQLTADTQAGLDQSRGVIDSHLARFAFREEFTAMDWTR